MCGIAGYIGDQRAAPFILDALKRLEYRGYDSWGVALRGSTGNIGVYHNVGRLSADETGQNIVKDYPGTAGIGHTRWATHGEVSVRNAHPIAGGLPGENDCFVVHNGIIDNHNELKDRLQKLGYTFATETDTEVIAHLFSYVFKETQNRIPYSYWDTTIQKMAANLRGQYACAILPSGQDDVMILASYGSPLWVTEEGHVASDISALTGYAQYAYGIPDGSWVCINHRLKRVWVKAKYANEGIFVFDRLPKVAVPVEPGESLGNHTTYMHKEIFEQPDCVSKLWLPKMIPNIPEHICLFGCGSSYHAALLGRHYFQNICEIPTNVEYATELTSGWTHRTTESLFIALTQSGETRDTILAMERVGEPINEFEPRVHAITNNSHSTAARLSCTPFITLDCGPERGVAATKTFTMQVHRLLELAFMFDMRRLDRTCSPRDELPKAMKAVFDMECDIQSIARVVDSFDSVLFLARGILFPIALEGALKMKEVSYIHAEAIHAGEMKHGPIALITPETLSIFLMTSQDESHVNKVCSNIQEIRARKGAVFAIVDDEAVAKRCEGIERILVIPKIHPYLQPILVNVVLQLLAYHVALRRGHDVDRPRNLAKSVTVE